MTCRMRTSWRRALGSGYTDWQAFTGRSAIWSHITARSLRQDGRPTSKKHSLSSPHMRRANLDRLQRWSNGVRRRVAANAVRAGESVVEDGLRRRCPVVTGKLRASVRATPPRAVRWGAFGMVVVGTDHAFAARHAIAATVTGDGRRAQQAMAQALMRMS